MKHYLYQENTLKYFETFFCFALSMLKQALKRTYQLGLLTFSTALLPFTAFSEDPPRLKNITVKGQVRLSPAAKIPPKGLDVVLLKFVLNPEGEVTPIGPQGRVKTNSLGNYKFVKVPTDFRAGFQLGTRVEGELYSSKIFFMKAGEKFIEKNIFIPGISSSVEKLETSKVSLVIEPGLGTVTVTEVLLFNNSTPDKIDTSTKLLVQKLPAGIENFRLIGSKSLKSIKHQLKDQLLKIAYIFPTGSTQIIYQYVLPEWFGRLQINREFEHSLEIVEVFTPIDRLQIKSSELFFSGKQTFNETTFLSWKSKISDSNRLNLNIKNVPTTSLQYAVVSVIIIILLFGSVALFYWQRLTKENNSKMINS